MQRAGLLARLIVVGAIMAITGCGESTPEVYRVHGRVLLDGKPLVGGGSIAFVPIGKQFGRTAGGEIAADGTYKLTTYKPGDGSASGAFKVMIVQTVDVEPTTTPRDGDKSNTGAAAVKAVGDADRISTIYSNPQKTPLTAKVLAINPNEIDFDLTIRDAPTK